MEKIIDKFIAYKNIIRDNITILVFIPTLIGGIHQAIQIVTISPSLIKFFSISQLVIDGVFILLYATIVMVLPILVSKPLISLTNKFRPSTLFRFNSFLAVSTIIYMLLLLIFHSKLKENTTLDFLSQIFQFFLVGCGINTQWSQSLERKNSWENLDRNYLIFILVFGILLSSLMFIKLSQKIPLANFEILEQKYQDNGKIEVLYFNDQYIFLKTKCDKKNGKIHIEKVDALFSN